MIGFNLLIGVIFIRKNTFDRKNVKLIQLYLELKFLHKNINKSLEGFLAENFCAELRDSIKEYYNLEEIIIFDSVRMELRTDGSRALKSAIQNFLQHNLNQLQESFRGRDFLSQKIGVNNKDYIIHICELAPEISYDSFIICVEQHPTLLTQNELLGLESNIKLLRTGLFYE